MKKSTILKIALLVLPLGIVAIAINPGSVVVAEGEAVRTTSFAEAVYGSSVGWCAPVMLLMTYGIFALAVFNLVTKKEVFVKIIRVAAFLATCLGACPVMIPGEVKVYPNVFAAILMGVLCGVAHFMLGVQKKESEKATEPKGRRLSGK